MLVFDASALVALFAAYPPVLTLWKRADAGLATIGVPALAIIDAADQADITASEWEAILWSPTVEILPLTGPVAVEVGAWAGPLAARHALWESRALAWPILTRDSALYPPDALILPV